MSNSNKMPLEGRKNMKNNPIPPTNINRPITRNEMRKTGTSAIVEEHKDIQGAMEGRKFLKICLLLCPLGESVTNSSLLTCMHQIARIANVLKQVINTIHALVFLIEEMEETTINEIVRDAVLIQLNKLTIDVRLLVKDVKEKIDKHIKKRSTELHNDVPTQPTH